MIFPSFFKRGPKPLALFQDDILTNSAAWKVISDASPSSAHLTSSKAGGKLSTEKLSLPKSVSLNAAKCSKLCQIFRQNKTCKFLITCGRSQVVAINFEEKHEAFGQSTILAEELDQISW